MIHQSLIYADKFGNAAMREVWTDAAMVQGWLDLEAALAWAQGEVGIIPRRTAAKIAKHCSAAIVTPTICMHHRTDRFAELGAVLANLLSTLGEFGMEVRDL